MVTVKVAGIGAAPGVGIAVVRVRTVLVDQAFFGKKLVQINGALPPAGERAIRPLEGVFVEPGVRLDDSEFGVAVPSANLKMEHYSMLFGATVLAGRQE